MTLYEKVQELKNRIASGEISGYTALDLFLQHVTAGISAAVPEQPPVDNDHVVAGAEQFTEAVIAANAPDPVPEPATDAATDEMTEMPAA